MATTTKMLVILAVIKDIKVSWLRMMMMIVIIIAVIADNESYYASYLYLILNFNDSTPLYVGGGDESVKN